MQVHSNQINDCPSNQDEDEIDLRELFATIYKHKFFIAVFVIVITTLTLLYAISKPNEYKISIKLAPQEQSKGLNLGGLGALASMAGVNVGGGSGITPDIAFSTLLDDYAFMKKFIIKEGLDKKLLNPILDNDYVFAFGYNGLYKMLHSKDELKESSKKIDFFSNIYKPIKKSITISSDKKSGIIDISCMSASRKFAYYTLNSFLKDATEHLVESNLQDIDMQINRYKKELSKTNNLELKSELAKLISSLIKQKVYINTSKYYKVKVIANPYIPDLKDKAKPKRGLIVIVAMITSLILAIFLIFFREFLSNSKDSSFKEKY